MSIEVIKSGALTTLQDLGRTGFQQYGVPVNGIMDERAHRIANALVGNPRSYATLEITLMGPTLRFQADAVIAITGGDLDAKLDGEPCLLSQPVSVKAGSELAFGKRRAGVRAYLAVRGGFVATPVMHSVSLFARGGYGGFSGRPLAKGDVIAIGEPRVEAGAAQRTPRRLRSFDGAVQQGANALIRVTAGREWRFFSEDARRAFQETEFKLTPQSDRMGFRIEGATLALTEPRQMDSEAVAFGTIQVPPDGNPIVLMADRQTTGGYPKIAQVCAVDLPRLAQKMPGEVIRFSVIDLDTAQRLLLSQEDTFAAMEVS
ncbi:5-oxoprolinase subunit C family protein [Paraburkholderia silvatlantica]|uniref:Urea carboxylase n=1 Tax=Paraburkholderia silvatlantica TaxID=321895 RepID=A0A2U1A9I8_9BURK|nr:biotin-dependent carboxyltransferase family protein [Paraburkholderia silvatlantica]MBB2930541.1 urea carboxylase [Paraburkholderia silvatlantica]PVY30345.1 urea carboxylase [Paraburkholderia silvatlantica]PXW36918.1 urea carboxylase [Paraburkholderia silvatlantica]PYE21258.1 urea carboxylase [Paraburkholderia silvatlantica]TDQ86601.1 urea carboxylase [Paraburkholderia silvatlantica]